MARSGKNVKWKKLHKDYPHIRVLRGIVGSDGIKYGAKNSSILWALVANRRGAKLPYFGKQGYNWTYSPHEQKRVDLRVFLKRGRGILEKIGARIGVISLILSFEWGGCPCW